MTAPAMPAPPLADTPLGRTIATTPTDIWNDSCAIDELEYAISFGAVGATANPTIVTDVWKKEPAHWRSRVQALESERPDASEAELAWQIVDEMSSRAAPLLLPAFEAHGGRKGRLSTQTDPTLHRSPERMVAQGLHFSGVAPNIIVKFPATAAGIAAIEEASALGISVNTTVCFSVAQAVAAAEAIQRGMRRRAAAGESVADMGPVVTIMMGRIEDWLRLQSERDGIVADPSALPWSGVAVFKRAYGIFQERGFTARLLGAAIRHHYHWSELIGGDVGITLPSNWQKRFNASSVEVRPRMDTPVDPAIVAGLSRAFPDFVRAYEPDGLAAADFDTFPPTARTLRAFIASYHELLQVVTDAMIPNPDLRSGG
ncbi:MAG TPA: transaldolase family protein [Candidatus Limnocylindrales bacterium]|nr:transaldolase family protein [Candidatus Limnocylindrales bacterium]